MIGAILPRQENRTPEGLRKFVGDEITKWTPIMKAAAIPTAK
jgi:hypothetical protein